MNSLLFLLVVLPFYVAIGVLAVFTLHLLPAPFAAGVVVAAISAYAWVAGRAVGRFGIRRQ